MYNEESKMANSILEYIQKLPAESSPEQVYNGWTKTDKNEYNMTKQERVKTAYRIIQPLLKASGDDIEVMLAVR
jgi:hypothetical protein